MLSRRGYRVFGTSRTPGADSARDYEMVQLDVRRDDSVKTCIDHLIKTAGRIDVVVNNAGYELSGAIEETCPAEAQEQFETNFFGVARVVQAVLPFMRHQRSGHIINISSLAGLIGVPFHGYYSAAKFALEGYSESLQHEVKNFNIRISIIEAGFMKTNLGASSKHAAREIDDYAGMRKGAYRYFAHAVESGDDPHKTAGLILTAIESPAPRLRYRSGSAAVWLPRIKSLVPWKMFAWGMRRKLHLG
jgi:NAD(P)-dependent dehydrogenase (short-subunit alcohol dehydrogenase family)